MNWFRRALFLRWVPYLRNDRRKRIKAIVFLIQFAFALICVLVFYLGLRVWGIDMPVMFF